MEGMNLRRSKRIENMKQREGERHIPGHDRGMICEQAREYAKKRGGVCIARSGFSSEYHWSCDKGHKWKAALEDMQSTHTWCPYCPWPQERYCRYILEDLLGESFPKCSPSFLMGLQFDGYCEKIRLAFEYNGKQHYQWVPHFQRKKKDFLQQKERDFRKRKLCHEHKIVLISIPYYCDPLIFIENWLDEHGILSQMCSSTKISRCSTNK